MKKRYKKLIDNLDIVQVIGEYANLKKTGSNYMYYSPLKMKRPHHLQLVQ